MESDLSPVILRFYQGFTQTSRNRRQRVETQHFRPSFAINESVPKSRPYWAAHTSPRDDSSSAGGGGGGGKWYSPKFTEILKTVFGPTPRKNPGYAPEMYIMSKEDHPLLIIDYFIWRRMNQDVKFIIMTGG